MKKKQIKRLTAVLSSPAFIGITASVVLLGAGALIWLRRQRGEMFDVELELVDDTADLELGGEIDDALEDSVEQAEDGVEQSNVSPGV